MGLKTIWIVVEAFSLDLKVELMKKFPRNFSPLRYSPQNNFESVSDKEKSAATRNLTLGIRGLAVLTMCSKVKHLSKGRIIHMLNPLDMCVVFVMKEVIDQMFVQQRELLLRKTRKRKRK